MGYNGRFGGELRVCLDMSGPLLPVVALGDTVNMCCLFCLDNCCWSSIAPLVSQALLDALAAIHPFSEVSTALNIIFSQPPHSPNSW